MKKILLALLVLVTMLVNMLAMTGCGLLPGNKDDGNGEEEGKVNITFYHTMGANLRDVLDEYIPEFEAMYPNINVIHEQVGGYDDVRDTISTELTVGEQPNIAYCYPDHVALYNVAQAVVVLDDYIDFEGDYTWNLDGTTISNIGLTQAQKDDFIQGYYEEGRQFGDGKMYTLPLSKSTEVLYYNKKVFAENNLTPPTTWDEMEEVCRILKEKYPDSIPLGYDSEANWFITMCEQLDTPYTSATGEHFLFNNAENRAFVKRFKGWFDKDYVTTQEIFGGYTSEIFKETSKPQRSFMSIGSSAGATHQRPAKLEDGSYPFEVGITSIPQIDAANNGKVISQGPSLCILENTNRDEVMASWLFMKFLTTNVAFQADFGIASGYVPVIKSVAQDATYADSLAKANGTTNIAALSAKVCLEQEAFYYTSPAFNGSSAARDQVGSLIQKCFGLSYTSEADLDAQIEAAFKAAVDECKYQTGK
ncbi:MAG: extracellular solute-binding protein [Ruminococcaceae bacterium]|nr:extracellular solute-binding protein [Oscillospiraceae bacterium]